MSMRTDPPLIAAIRHDVSEIRGNWLWFVLLGVALVVLGFVALGSMVIASLAATLALGTLILLAGLAETIGSFWAKGWSGFFLHMLSGVLSIVVGILFIRAPVNAEIALTLLLACLLMVGGIFKIVAVASHRFAAWGLMLASGVIDVLLGLMIWQQRPFSGLWVIGLFLGINLIFRGLNWIGLGMALRSMPKVTE